MNKFYLKINFASCLFFFSVLNSSAQNCAKLTALFQTYESRCASTGSIKVTATGGSGSYKYKTVGPVNSNFTTSDSITGLAAGNYTVIVNDIVTNCTYTKNNVIVSGTYEDPRFTLSEIDVSCDKGNNGSITANNQLGGRNPFTYSIVAPSPAGVGTSNNTGIFNNLSAGIYSIQLADSCGGIQTRQITVNDYSWNLNSYSFTKVSCDSASGFIKAVDSRGNTSNAGGIPGFTYGAVKSPGDTVWSTNATFTFNLGTFTNFEIIVKDNCGKIKKASTSASLVPSVGGSVNISGKSCDKFSVSLKDILNFSNGLFCLYDKNNVQISCNNTGTFTNIPYGNYCITAHDGCTDSLITRCFNVLAPPLSVGPDVILSNKNCTSFTASITGQVGLTNPNYCLFDQSHNQLQCNSTGVFDNLAYGDYCIETTDGCRDTTIQRCFSAMKPIPLVDEEILPSYLGCNMFGIEVHGDSLTNPTYCLYDSLGAVVSCNSTGIFDSLSLGYYCVRIHDDCLDTTFIRCFNAGPPILINTIIVTSSNKTCSAFTATATATNLTNPYYCLYNSSDSLLSCDSTGIFDGLAYGSYCIKTKNDCPDTTFINCFTVTRPVPSVNTIVKRSNYTCTTFSAQITNQKNLTNPQFCIYDVNDVLITCNTTGTFDALPFGSYCIKITNTCFDTTFTRCFSASALPVSLSVTSNKSCNYGYAIFNVNINATNAPVNVKIYNPAGNLFWEGDYSTSNFSVNNIPGTLPGETYKVVAADNCGKKDSVTLTATASYVNHSSTVNTKCPGGSWANGSGDILASVGTNMGSLTVRIFSKNGLLLSPQLVPNSVSGGIYKFNDLGPATYILSYKANDACNKYLYDTVVVNPYHYPNLTRSSAYQCDVNGFSVGAVVADGVGPFSYSIIGSSPASPSIVQGPQSSPIFNIDNGTNYSLIRLRALDACGNATLGDASVLPLADNKISSTSNCFLQPTTLSVDPIANSSYLWYKKDSIVAGDSVLINSGSASIYIPNISPEDTGSYVCHLSVLNGCVTRSYSYQLDGSCFTALPLTLLEFTGKITNEQALLNWKTIKENDLALYVVEKLNPDNTFSEIGRINPANNSSYSQQYYFLDQHTSAGLNYYRLKIINSNQAVSYSKVISLEKASGAFQMRLFPNPANEMFTIEFTTVKNHLYKVSLFNFLNQPISETIFNPAITEKLQIRRTKSVSPGVYVVRITDLMTNDEYSQKVIFR